jgi:hypothetical protein
MHLLAEDIENIGHIISARYFTDQGWRFTDLKQSRNKIIEAHETVNEQYSKYPYMSKDWYVENSVQKNYLPTTRWENLDVLAHFLQNWPDQFDFILKINAQTSLCIVKTKHTVLTTEQENAIENARKTGYNVYVFKAYVPDIIDFELEEVMGGISGRGVFKFHHLTDHI